MSTYSAENPPELTVVPYAQLGNVALQPFQLIAGVPSVPSFKTIEERACTTVLRPYYAPRISDEDILRREDRIYRDRITRHLRPTGFNGSLLEGYVTILPFDASRAAELDKTAQQRMARGDMPDETPGLTLVYGGELWSSRTGRIGELFLESMIYLERPLGLYYPGHTGLRSGNYLRRIVGPKTVIEAASAIVQESQEESVATALKHAKFALSHLYPGGIPGSRRRK